jgi:hypothetical protein
MGMGVVVGEGVGVERGWGCGGVGGSIRVCGDAAAMRQVRVKLSTYCVSLEISVWTKQYSPKSEIKTTEFMMRPI